METKQGAEKVPPAEEEAPEQGFLHLETDDSTPPNQGGGPKTGYPLRGEE